MAQYGIEGEFSGWVYKQGSLVKNWKKRFMVLNGRQLTYYNTLNVTPDVKAKGSIQVITVELSTAIQNGLLVHGRGGRVLKLYTASAEATSAWYNMILNATTASAQQFVAAPPDRFSTHSATKSASMGNESELLERLESLPLSEDGSKQVTHSGWLKKEGARIKSWKRRYFVLRSNALSYFDSEDTGTAAKGYGHVRAVEVNAIVTFGLDILFDSGRVLRVSAKTSGDMETWLCQLSDAIEATFKELNDVRQSLAVSSSYRASLTGKVAPSRMNFHQGVILYDGTNTRPKTRHSIAAVPSKPRGSIAETPEMSQRRTAQAKQFSLYDLYSSSDMSSQSCSPGSYDHLNLFTRPNEHRHDMGHTLSSSDSTFFDSDDEFGSEDSEGDWI